jgi:putative peptidoglycan lipid II flippase
LSGSSKLVVSSVLTSPQSGSERPDDGVAHTTTNESGFGSRAVRLLAFTLAAQAISFGSSIAIARILGATRATDAYYLALSIPMLVYSIFLSTVGQCGIPKLTEEATASRSAFVEASSQLISATLIVSIIISALAAAAAVPLFPVISSPSIVSLAQAKVIELAPLGLLGAMTGAMASVLAVRNRFAAAALVPALDPLLRIVLLVVAGDTLGTNALVIANLAGNLLAVLVLWVLIRRERISLGWRSPLRSPFVRRVLAFGTPLMLSAAILQVNPVVDRAMASDLGGGMITALELGLRLVNIPALLIGATLIGPIMATWAARRAAFGWPALRDSINRATEVFTMIVPPVVVIGIILRHQIVEVLYQGGAYSAHATLQTATVFAMLLAGLPAQALMIAFSTLFVIEKRPNFCLMAGMANVILHVVLNFALRAVWGVGGIALSTSVTASILLAAYVIVARRQWEGIRIPFASLLRPRAAAPVIVMTLVAYGLLTSAPSVAGRVGLTAEIVVVAAAAFFVYAMLLLLVDEHNRALFERVCNVSLRAFGMIRHNQAQR